MQFPLILKCGLSKFMYHELTENDVSLLPHFIGAVYTEDKLEYTFFPVKKTTVNLSVKAPHNAHICLAQEASSEATPMIEIFIGGWENGKSAIRLNREKPDKTEAITPFICSADEDKNFVLSWTNDGEVSLAMDGASEPFLYWKNEEPFPINQLGVRTAYGATGNWKFGGFLMYF